MKKYYWPVNKYIDFLKNKKEDIEIEACFIQQLISYEDRFSKITNTKTIIWNDVTFKEIDEKLVRNTYINRIAVKKLNNYAIDDLNISYNKEKDKTYLIKKKKYTFILIWPKN